MRGAPGAFVMAEESSANVCLAASKGPGPWGGSAPNPGSGADVHGSSAIGDIGIRPGVDLAAVSPDDGGASHGNWTSAGMTIVVASAMTGPLAGYFPH